MFFSFVEYAVVSKGKFWHGQSILKILYNFCLGREKFALVSSKTVEASWHVRVSVPIVPSSTTVMLKKATDFQEYKD